MHGIKPFGYIRDLLILVPSWPHSRVVEPTPVNWATTSAREDVVAQRRVNVFKRLGSE